MYICIDGQFEKHCTLSNVFKHIGPNSAVLCQNYTNVILEYFQTNSTVVTRNTPELNLFNSKEQEQALDF